MARVKRIKLSFLFRMLSFGWLGIVLVLSAPSDVPAAGDLFEHAVAPEELARTLAVITERPMQLAN